MKKELSRLSFDPRRLTRHAAALWIILSFFLVLPYPHLQAKVSGPCSNCHTMHNSQDGSMVNDGGLNKSLTRRSCLGCHAQVGGEKIVTIAGNEIPQVYHTDATDLAAGNFAFISGTKGGSASDSKGHNVVSLVGQDGTHGPAPGVVDYGNIHSTEIHSSRMSCAGEGGCHGLRLNRTFNGGASPMEAISGSHHGGGADYGGRYYRFLSGVEGLPNPDPAGRWQNKSSGSHNEYFGFAESNTVVDGCGSSFGGIGCHATELGDAVVAHYSISNFCASCHLDYHTLKINDDYLGIGEDGASPFLRHPVDLVLPASGEFAAYTTYDPTVPVGRQTLPASPSGVVTPGQDVVTCLSCHMAHASPYPDMLRWDYSEMITGGGETAAGKGCLVCHTNKD